MSGSSLHARTRSKLAEDRPHERIRGTPLERELLSAEALEDSMRAALAAEHARGDVWLFAYGSLVWNPAFEFTARRVAMVQGFHRRFCLWSRINRGSPDKPGLVLGLDHGGSCHGVVYRIPRAHAEQELRLLWRREMLLGSYLPRWLNARTPDEPVHALAFVINHQASGFAPHMADEQIVDILTRGQGRFGNGLDYLRETVAGLAASGVPDHHLERLVSIAAARGL